MEKNSVRFAVMLLAFGVGVAIAGVFYFKTQAEPVPEIAEVVIEEQQQQQRGGGEGKTLEMVFVIDTTGSMGGLIEGAKQKTWQIINDVMQKSSKLHVKVGLVAYRDQGDQYVTRVLPLTDDLDKVYMNLMDYEAAGGGDRPEAVGSALADAVAKAGWSKDRKDVAQIIFLVGDAPPQTIRNEPNVLEITKNAARQNMIINTIQCGKEAETEKVWQEIAQRGQGKYFAIDQDGGVETIKTPYDDRLSQLGTDMGGTYTSYGGAEVRAKSMEGVAVAEEKISNAAPTAARADRALNKALNSKAYSNDLLQDIESGKTQIGSVKDEELPADLKAMPAPQRPAEIQKRLDERKKIREEILSVSKQRAAYLEEQRKRAGKSSGFDAAVGNALSEQLKLKGIN
ncbi:MAG TPA: vWA domain-containing protein [Pyrinomonadaceae bacterium]|jgi:Mg-chelatase subunit ChlD|nr:vWA domain-containing protein [Pyrinomonadaceae bacterium]